MKYYNVSFQSGTVFCSNIAQAQDAETVAAHYSKYEWHHITEATEGDVKEAQRKGKPIITL